MFVIQIIIFIYNDKILLMYVLSIKKIFVSKNISCKSATISKYIHTKIFNYEL